MPTQQAAMGFWTAQQRNNARQGRALLQGLYGSNDATPMNGTRSGVVPTTGLGNGSDLRVTVTSGLTMAVAAGTAVAHRSGQGPYEGWLAAAGSVTCDPAPATNPRNDIVVARFYDPAPGVGDTLPASGDPFKIEIITGSPGPVPVDPVSWNSLGVITSFPAQTGSGTGGIGIPLARAQVSTGGVITLTDLRMSTAPVGAVRYLLPGDNPAAAPVRAGEMQFNPATGALQVSDVAGAWNTISTGTVARGWVGGATYNADLNVNTGTEQALFAASFTASAGRRYIPWANFEYYQKSGTAPYATNMLLHLRIVAGGTATGTGGTILRGIYPNTPRDALFLTEPCAMIGDPWIAPSSGVYTVSVSGKVDSGQGGIAGGGTDHTYGINIEDKGV
jgi:hypothetical protein